jgi:hypothetical protein
MIIIENKISYDVCKIGKCRFWHLNGELHRENGPTVEGINDFTYKAWYNHGKPHRIDGPAVIFTDGIKQYYLNGIWYPEITSDEEWLIKNIIE